uniref:Uncharacterized protein n=1 Tax=Denticeps clupeoides TaxID=299321 RepID=A0AAY4DKP5_9TELE
MYVCVCVAPVYSCESVVSRTATIWKTLSPFWGEEYNVHLPPSFHTVSFHVLDERLSQTIVIGKVSVSKDSLTAKPQGEKVLTHRPPDDEVQGEIHLHMSVLGDWGRSDPGCAARDLARKDRNGASDPFVRVQYNGKTHESTVSPHSHTFHFELDDAAADSSLSVEVWDWDLVSRKRLLGKGDVLFNISGLQLAQQEEGWFRLGARQTQTQTTTSEGALGALRLQLRLRDETVLPPSCYQPLTQLLQLTHVHTRVHTRTTTAESRQEVATNLVNLFLGQGQVTEFLDVLFKLELDKTSEPNTLFRSNSLASKSMESFLKVAGMQYLHKLLGPVINRIYEEKRYVELDPQQGGAEGGGVGCTGLHRVHTEAEIIQQSVGHLQSYLSELLHAIQQSASYCPALLCHAFRQLYERVENRFPEPEYRTVQSIANMDTLACCPKEPWIVPLQPAVQQGIAQLKDFISRLVLLWCFRPRPAGPHESPVRLFFVTLSRSTLSYSRTQNSKKSSFISLGKVKAVEKVEEKSFGSANVMQIIWSEESGQMETLYLDCKSMNELNHWLSTLRKACSRNADTLSCYHPGVYKADRWSCCHQKDRTDPGCDRTNGGVMLQEWYDPPDHELQAQFIFRHLLGVRNELRAPQSKFSQQKEIRPPSFSGRGESDAVAELFTVLQELHAAHRAAEEEEHVRNKNFFPGGADVTYTLLEENWF